MGRILSLVGLIVLAGLLGATLLRLAPGFDTDERELDPRLSEASREEIRAERSGDRNILSFYGRYLQDASRGDLGLSRSLGQPVTELFRERFPVTARLAGIGLLVGWSLALPAALIAIIRPGGWLDGLAGIAGGLAISVPSALIALAILHFDGWLPLGVGIIVFPRIYAYLRNILVKVSRMPHILAALARGVGKASIIGRHVLPVAMPEVGALAGVSVTLALGAAVPVEVLCSQPGIGQLAWQAALSRDLPVLVGLTWIAAAITLSANTLAGWARSGQGTAA
jgi:peptide/nickel transport system permease protein